MLQITAIESQRKDPKRFNIYVDGKFSFAISLEGLLKEKLVIGNIISNETIDNFVFSNEVGKIYDRVLNFLSYRPRSKKEIINYLNKKKISSKASLTILKKLEDLGLVNDLEFANWWVDNRLHFRPKGKIVIKSELIQKGIPQQIIETVLAKIDSPSQKDIAIKLAQKQLPKYKGLDHIKKYQRLASYLSRKGFDWQTVKSAIDTCFEKM